MKTLRRNRILLGWFMTVLVFTMQVATPLKAATFFWGPGGLASNSGFWDTTSFNWGSTSPTGNTRWVNSTSNTAIFTNTATIRINEAITLNGITFQGTDTFVQKNTSGSGSLTFGGTTPTVTLQGSSATSATLNRIIAPLFGTSGLTIQSIDTAATPTPANGATLVLGQSGSNYANNLSGGITLVGAKKAGTLTGGVTTLQVAMSSLNVATLPDLNPLGTNAVTLGTNTQLRIAGTTTTDLGYSGRVFASGGVTDSSRVDFSQTATGASLPTTNLVANTSGSSTAISTATTAGLYVGETVTGAGVPANTVVASVDSSTQFSVNNSLNLSAAALTITPPIALTSGGSPTLSGNPVQNITAGLDGSATSAIQYTDISGATKTATNYAIQWAGKLSIGHGGGYTFFASSDDASRVYVDGVLVLNNDGGKGSIDLSSGVIHLAAGYHDVVVDYVQGTGGAALNLGYAGPDTLPSGANGLIGQRVTLDSSNSFHKAEINTASGFSNAIQMGNAINVTGNASISLQGGGFTSAQLGALSMTTGTTLSVLSVDVNGAVVSGNDPGFGQTVRFSGTTGTPTLFGSGTAGTVTIASDANVAFDGVVSVNGVSNMNILKTGTGRLYFNQTSSANPLLASTTITADGTTPQSVTAKTNSSNTIIPTSTSTLSIGMGVSGSGIPTGTVITAIGANNVVTLSNAATTSLASTSLTFTPTAGTTPQVVTANTSSSNTIIPTSTSNLSVGMGVRGAGIPAGTVITAIGANNVVTLNNATTTSLTSTLLTFTPTTGAPPTLVLTGSTAAGAFNPIGAAGIVMTGGSLVLDSKGATAAGLGPTFNNPVSITGSSIIQSVVNAATTVLGSSTNGIALSPNTTLTLDAIAGGQTSASAASTDPGATLAIAGNITGDATTALNLASTILNAVTTVAASAATPSTPQQTGNSLVAQGTVALRGDNTGFLGAVSLAPNMGLRVEGVKALTGKSFALSGNTLSLLSDGSSSGTNYGTSGRENIAFNDALTINATSTILVDRLGNAQSLLFTQAANKTAQISSLAVASTVANNTNLTVTNNDGYGLEVTGATTLSATPTFTVANATNSNALAGNTLTGVVSGGNNLFKAGNGTLALGNASNSFGTIQSVNSFGASGSNALTLNVDNYNNLLVGQSVSGTGCQAEPRLPH